MPKNSYVMIDLLKKKGITQRDLARESNIPESTLNRYLNGNSDIPLSKAKRIADSLGITLDDLTQNSSSNIYIIPVLELDDLISEPDCISITAKNPATADLVSSCTKPFWIRVADNSINRVIPKGYLARVVPLEPKTKVSAYENNLLVMVIDKREVVISRLRWLSNGVELIPDSWDITARPKTVDFGEKPQHTLCIIGKVESATMPSDYII